MAQYKELQIFKEMNQLSQIINRAISTDMKKEHRYDIGDEIRQLMRDMKFQIYLINVKSIGSRSDEFNKLSHMYNHLKILLDECIEMGYLKLKGPHSIHEALKKLVSVGKQAAKWRNYDREIFGGK